MTKAASVAGVKGKVNHMNPWNDDKGDWQNLAMSKIQVPRYAAVGRIVGTLCPGGSVLDVGCGEGVLLRYLPNTTNYLGIEPSKKAAGSASTTCGRDSIVHTTAEEFDAQQRQWDCIIFNEMLYYATAPLMLVRKYSRLLRPNGIMVISIFQKAEPSLKRRLWWTLTGRIWNIRCTKMVLRFMTRNGWMIQVDELVTQHGTSNCWRIIAASPRRM